MEKSEKLNLGCGADIREDYLNVDGYAYEGVDVVTDITKLTFPSESFSEILAKDVLEHLTFVDAKKLLRDCYDWLKPNGTIMLHVQNLPYLASHLCRNEDFDDKFHFEVLKWIYGVSAIGDSKSPFRYHHWGYSEKSLSKILQGIGFYVAQSTVDCEGFGLLVIACKRGNDGGK